MTREERELSIKYLEDIKENFIEREGYEIAPLPVCYATENAIKSLKQEPFINKPCVSSEVCEHDKNKVLDKIRAEIETKYGQCSICEYDSDYGGKWYQVGDIADILQIIDKYSESKAREYEFTRTLYRQNNK